MKRTTYLLLASLFTAITLTACGPKPPVGEADRQHAEDALDQLK